MKIGILTSSRADYGIYLPLLKKMQSDCFFDLEIIAFGTHLSKFHGYTIQEIQKGKYSKVHTLSTLITNDDEQSISTSYGLTSLKFADFWANKTYDCVFCLGDRFEMSAAVQAGIPFGIKFAHLHGGETTLGAIDNIYRHQITLASYLHFVAVEEYKNRVTNLLGNQKHIYTVGALSLNDIDKFEISNEADFYKQFDIPNAPFALVTFQPETIASNDNKFYAQEMKTALTKIASYINLVITMPNADAFGADYREAKIQLKREYPDKIVLVENFGKKYYFSAMNYAKILIGNTSSAIIEAASFRKFAINVGRRQEGRSINKNVITCEFTAKEVIQTTEAVLKLGDYTGTNIYYKVDTVDNIIKILKETIH